jgi:hypothetical protein
MSLGHGASIVRDNLVLHLDAANRKSYSGSGTVWTELSGVSNDGTLVNGTSFDSNNLGYFSFDGVNDYINCGVIPGIDSSATQFSVSVWLKTQTKTTKIILENGNNWNTNTFFLAQENASYFSFQVYGDGGYDAVYANYVYQTDVWYNLIGIWSAGNRVDFYTNGVIANGTRVGSVRSSVITGNTNMMIGSRAGSSLFFQGEIPEVKIYNRALSPQEIRQNFEATRGRYGI